MDSVVSSSHDIIVVDFASYDSEKRYELCSEICRILRSDGFLYLKNHQIPAQLIEDVFEKSRRFFTLPLEEKLNVKRPDGHRSLSGYNPVGQEKLNPSSSTEIREAFDVVHPDIPIVDKPPEFLSSLLKLETACRELGLKVLHCIAIGMNLPDEHFFEKCHRAVADPSLETESGNLFRSLYYPPYPASDEKERESRVRLGTHSDYGSVTLLFQDDVGGLEIETEVKDVFVPAVPVPGAVLINIGDLLQRWTSNELRATRHRVLLNDASKSAKARQSIAMFIHPDGDTVIKSLTGTELYPPILTRDHILSRYLETY